MQFSATPIFATPVSRKTASPYVLKAALLLALAVLLPLAPADAQPSGTRLWTRQEVESPTGVTTPHIASDAAGDVFVTVAITHLGTYPGYPLIGTADFLTIKYDPDGHTLWTRHFRSAGDGDDIPAAIATDKHGNVIVAGTSFGSGTGDDFKIIKYDPNGGALWSRRYNSPFSVPAALGGYQPDDQVQAMALDPNGNVLVTGTSFNGQFETRYDDDDDPIGNYPLYDQLTVKLKASNGRRLYEYRGAVFSNTVKIASDPSGNAIVAGTQFDGYGQFTTGGVWVRGGTGKDLGVYELNPAGVKMWGRSFDGQAHTDDILNGMTVGSDGSVYLAGTLATHILYVIQEEGYRFFFAYDIATIKLTPGGTRVWEKRYDEGDSAFATDIGVDDAGNVFVTGGSSPIITLKYDAAGQRQWYRHFLDPFANTIAKSLVPDGHGGVVAVILAATADFSTTDTKTIHYDPAGDTLFSVRDYADPGDTSLPGGVVLDGQGNVVVVSSFGTNNGEFPNNVSTDAHLVTTKYTL